jgi:hypothetical protein
MDDEYAKMVVRQMSGGTSWESFMSWVQSLPDESKRKLVEIFNALYSNKENG